MRAFFVRRDNKTKRGKNSRLQMLVLGTAAVLFSFTLALYIDWLRVSRLADHLLNSILYHPYFSVSEISVTGGEKVGGSEIIVMAGLQRGMKIWKVNSESIEAKVKKHPWVRKVLVRRDFPERVVIQVEEWVAKGIVVLGGLYYVNDEGFVFKEVAEDENVNLPLITGLSRGSIVSHSRLARQRIAEALRLRELFGESSFSLSEIHFGPHGGVVVYPMSTPVALYMGWGGWPGKVRRIRRVLTEWRGKENRLALLDVSFRNQVVARLREGVAFGIRRSAIGNQHLTTSKG